MHVYAVAGGDGSGKTATALNLAVAFRANGQYAAVLDATLDDNVSALLGIDHDHTMEDVLDGDASLRDATVDFPLSPDRVPESDLLEYRRSIIGDRTRFREREADPDGVDSTDFPDVGEVPIIAGWPSSRRLASASEAALEDALQELVMAYDCIVVDTGGESIAGTAPVAVADGVAVVTTSDRTHTDTATQIARDCQRNDAPIIGTVVNRVGDDVSVTDVTGTVGIEAVGVVPSDDRTPALEPVRYAVPDSPAADAYDRLASSLDEWQGAIEEQASSATDGGGPGSAGSPHDPDGGGDRRDGRERDGTDDDEDSGGFLSGLFG
jgi:septum site-determining protein MinD